MFLERCHWETTLWIDGKEIGLQNSLATPHVFDITKYVSAGEHQLSIRVDNRVKDINVGPNSHSISDHTQSNWNGMIGKLYLAAYSPVYINQVALYPDIENKQVKVRVQLMNMKEGKINAGIELNAVSQNAKAEKIKSAVTKA